ncbi:MAG: fatty acyl-AMP ligase [Actinomycetota bacterium]|nr:fatty acyl-AMP ligase [Actinomycetota bacterium]
MTTGEPTTPIRTSWPDVHARAMAMAAVLVARGVREGNAIAVLAASPVDIAPVAQAIWLVGGSVTMLHQPTARTDMANYAHETATVLRVIGASQVVVGAPFEAAAPVLAAGGAAVLTIPQLDAAQTDARCFQPIDVPESSTALLQLTSGSTAMPKAVNITHANLWANIEAMCATADLRAGHDVMVSWLPLFHDMGMVGFLTLPMCRGIELVKVTPADFLRNPLLWPELISTHGGTCTAAPNFAYAITARALARPEVADTGLDLATLRFALNGAEPIDVSAVRAFLAAGAPFGLPATAMVPAYGMAEATLGVAFHPWGTPLKIDTVQAGPLENDRKALPANESVAGPDVRQFPVLGPPLPGIEVIAAADDGRRLGDREVGVLQLRGAAVTSEYLTVDGPRPTRGRDGWLDTGDLGYLTGGEVVVCGRVKDVIIMGGRNIYPTDIERVAQTVDGVRAGNAAAVRWATTGGRESFAVLVESREAADDAAAQRISAAVRSAVTATIGARPAVVKVLAVGTLPKTPSGKIKRVAAAGLLD